MSADGVQRIVRASRIYDAQEVERRDGPRYLEAVIEARRRRHQSAALLDLYALVTKAIENERKHGCPAGFWRASHPEAR